MKDKDINSLAIQHREIQIPYCICCEIQKDEYNRTIKQDIGKILRQLCQQKGIEIIEAEICKDHIHMLISIPLKYSVSNITGYLKGESSLIIFDHHAKLKYKYGNRHF